MKRMLIAATALTLAGTLSGCGGDDEPKAEPTPTESASTSASESNTPEPTWDDEFSPAQMKNYRAARDRWLEYWKAYTQAARTGADTPGVKAMFEKYSLTPLGERSRFLDLYVRGGVRMEVPPKVLWTSAAKIQAKTVIFNYCLDDTDSRTVNTNGDVNPRPNPLRRLVTVQMEKTSEGWKKRGYLNQEKVRPCGKSAP